MDNLSKTLHSKQGASVKSDLVVCSLELEQQHCYFTNGQCFLGNAGMCRPLLDLSLAAHLEGRDHQPTIYCSYPDFISLVRPNIRL